MESMKKGNVVSMMLVAAMSVTLALSGCSSAKSSTQSSSGSKDLVIYTALQQDDMSWITQQFKKDTGINISYMLFSAGDLETKIQSQMSNPQADVMLGGSVEYYEDLDPKGAFVKYTSPNAKSLKSEFKDSKGYFQGWYLGVLSIFYNTEQFNKILAPEGLKPPTTWDDLLDARYKKQFVTSNPSTAGGGYIFVADQLFRLGNDKGWTYLQNLNKNVDHYTKGADDPISLVATGQFVAGMSWAHDVLKTEKQGYPIKVVVPPETAYEIGGVAAIKNAKNTANAKKFIDWLLTKPVQQKNTSVSNRYSVLTSVAAPQGMIPMAQVKLVNYDRQKATEEKSSVIAQFNTMIGQ